MGVCDTLTSEIRWALVVRGGWNGHQPVTISDSFVPFLKEQRFTVEPSEDLAVYDDAERLAATDLVVQCWTMGTITPQQRDSLAAAVRGGIVDCFHDHGYHLLTGGKFVMHPPGFLDDTYQLSPGHADHPIIAGLDDFAIHSEQHWVLTDAHIDVLATTTFPADDLHDRPAVMPAVWTRAHGAGRVFVSTIGHKPDDFDVPQVRTLTERGLLWASR